MALKNVNVNMADSATTPRPKLKKRPIQAPTSPVGSGVDNPVLRKPRKTVTPVNPPVRKLSPQTNRVSGSANARKSGAEIPAPVKPKTQKQRTDPWKTGW